MKRTTVILDASLDTELRRLALRQGRTLTEVLQAALRAGLHTSTATRRAKHELPSYDLGPFLIDPADRERTAGLGVAPPRPGSR